MAADTNKEVRNMNAQNKIRPELAALIELHSRPLKIGAPPVEACPQIGSNGTCNIVADPKAPAASRAAKVLEGRRLLIPHAQRG